ncbi:hypothetical protein BHM03_00022209 [Ensete ventricosum]|nr:hypothetical protein BHM03_00022209 [Ensete ventricosum]
MEIPPSPTVGNKRNVPPSVPTEQPEDPKADTSTRVRVIRSRGRHVADVSGQDLPTTTTSRRCRRILSLAFPNTSVHTTTSGTQVSPGVGPATLRQVTRLVATGCPGEKAGRVSDCILRRVADVAGSGQGHFRESIRPKTL